VFTTAVMTQFHLQCD